jgi:ankyrin repeat protein
VSLQCRYGKIDVLVLVSESEGKGTEDAPYTVIDQPTLLMRAIAYNLGDAGVLEKEKFLSLYSEHTDAGPKQIKRITDENFYVKESRDDKVHYRNPYPSDLAFPHAMPLNLLKAALMSTTDPEQLRQIDPGTLWAKMREDESVDLLDNLTHPAVRRYRAADQQNNIALESLALEEVMRDPPERQEQALFKLMGNGEIALSVRIAELLDSAEWHDSNGENVLHRAARLGCNEVLDKLLPRMAEAAPGADGCISFFVNACLMKKPPVAERNKDGETPLMLAALSGDDATVRSLLKHVKRVDEKSNAGMTALMYAASRGHQQVMQLLLDMNANPKAQDRQCRTALHMARDVATARVLIAAGANVNARNEYEETPLMTAVDTDDAALVDLLASMSELNRTDDDGDTALIRAARGKRAALGALLARGADVNYQPSSGWTPLAAAAGVGDVDIVQHLIDKGAEIDKISVDGMTALCLAADCGSVDVVSLLLQKNADRTLVDDEGNSPLLLAAMQGHHEVVAALVAGRRPGTPDGLEAALFFARQRGHEAVVNLLRPVLRNQVRDDSPEPGDRE